MGISQIGVSSSGVSVRRQAFTSSGSWTAPTGVSIVKVFLVGGGGGGAGHVTNASRTQQGGGGGGGQVIEQYLNVTPGTSYTVTIGAGGSAGGASTTKSLTPGGVGGDSSFGSLLTAYGGGGGGSYQQANGAQPRPRYSVGGETGDGSQGALNGMAGGGGGAGIPFQGLNISEANPSAFLTSYSLGQGGHGGSPSNNGNGTANPYAYSSLQTMSYAKKTLRHLYPHASVDDGSFTSDNWFGGCLGGMAPPEWTATLTTFRAGKGAGGYGGITGLGFGGGGGGGSWYLNSGSTFTIQGTLPAGSAIGSGRGNDGGGDGALSYYHAPGNVTYNATAGAANTGGGGGGCSTYGTNLYTANSAAGGSGYCVVEWIA